MNQENTQTEATVSAADTETKNSGSKLLRFDDNNTVKTVTPAKDINSKITSLGSDLEHLRAELVTINNSVEEGLDRLSDTDTDLTAKVSETYKRLGEIDNAYKSLLDISSRIDTDIQMLTGDVSHVAKESASGIKYLEQSTIAQSHEFTQKNQQVVSRVNQLVETSKLSNDLLNQKIQSATESMLKIEKSVITEIETLTATTKEQTDSIEHSVDSNKAKILKLQSVDEAIIRRATTLEISSAELMVVSQRMDEDIVHLQKNTDILFTGVSELKQRTDELEALTNTHGFMINGLQKATSDITAKLAALAGRESKHFNIFTASFILLVIATAVIYFLQQNQFALNDTRYVERSEIIDVQLASLKQQQVQTNLLADHSLDELKYEIANVQDQVQSVEGRLSQSSPFSQIGSDNVIHGEQWISALPENNFTVQLAYVDDKTVLYEIAQRYNSQLKDSLSYFSVNDAVTERNGAVKYVLLSGNYATQQQAMAAIKDMPGYIDMKRPQVRKLEEIQNYIAR